MYDLTNSSVIIQSYISARIPGASGTATAVRVKMEPRDESKSPKILALDDIPAAGNAVSEAPATSDDNAALMRKLQECAYID